MINGECKHGQLARSCNICELENELKEAEGACADLMELNDKLQAEVEKLKPEYVEGFNAGKIFAALSCVQIVSEMKEAKMSRLMGFRADVLDEISREFNL